MPFLDQSYHTLVTIKPERTRKSGPEPAPASTAHILVGALICGVELLDIGSTVPLPTIKFNK